MAPAASTSTLSHRILYHRPFSPALNIAGASAPTTAAVAVASLSAEPITAIRW
jgi:hypothetical protein